MKKNFEICFRRAHENAGSLKSIAISIGYFGKGRHGHIRDMWLGRISIPERRIPSLAKLAKMSIEEIMQHKVSKEQNEECDNWMV